jgi:hypothetical protein
VREEYMEEGEEEEEFDLSMTDCQEEANDLLSGILHDQS